jgi:hypothetical protein
VAAHGVLEREERVSITVMVWNGGDVLAEIVGCMLTWGYYLGVGEEEGLNLERWGGEAYVDDGNLGSHCEYICLDIKVKTVKRKQGLGNRTHRK